MPDGCDAYLLKHIIHDWSDEHCRTILSLMRDKLPKHGRVLVCEMVVSDEPGPTPAKLLDIEMLVMTVGGKERTPEEFGELFAASRLAAQPHRPHGAADRGDRGGSGLGGQCAGAIAFHRSAGKPRASTVKICLVTVGCLPLQVQS